MTATHDNNAPIVYWHRDLPPLDAELVAEHTVEANSSRVAGTLAHRDELWDQCYQELMTNTTHRLVEEVARLGGHYAHVHDKAISPKQTTPRARPGCMAVSLTCVPPARRDSVGC